MAFNDDEFFAYAEDAEKPRSSGNNNTFTDDTKWTGMETNIPKIVRVVGAPPGRGHEPTDSIIITKARIRDDNGKYMEVYKPSHLTDKNYILNKIINRVTRPTWINDASGRGTKIFPVEKDFPEIYNIIEKNGLTPSDPAYRYDRGWKGTEVIIMNVIDRSQMDWHEANKHTMLLAKSINTDNKGNEYVDKGVSSFAVNSRLGHLFKAYGSWEKYDIAFTKTGRKDNPYNIINASQSPLEVDSAYQKYISTAPDLTDEERSWERYDLKTKFAYTSATKIMNRLGNTIKKIDHALGTEYYDELQELVNQEKVDKLSAAETVDSYTSPTPIIENEIPEPVAAAPVRPTREPAATITDSTAWRDLPYGENLPEDQKPLVKKVTQRADGGYDVVWDSSVESQLVLCPSCKTPSLVETPSCPGCGMQF